MSEHPEHYEICKQCWDLSEHCGHAEINKNVDRGTYPKCTQDNRHEGKLVKGPFGPHYSKEVCINCGKMLKWVSKFEYSLRSIDVPSGLAFARK